MPGKKIVIPKPEKPSILDYSDYRQYLTDYMAYRKVDDPHYSFATICKDFSLSSRTFIHKVVNKERDIAIWNALIFARNTKMNAKETDYFETLVQYNKSRTPLQQKLYFRRLKKFRGTPFREGK